MHCGRVGAAGVRLAQAHLTTTALAVHTVERTVREIATLNQLFSTAVLHQAEAIETIYNNAVDASLVRGCL